VARSLTAPRRGRGAGVLAALSSPGTRGWARLVGRRLLLLPLTLFLVVSLTFVLTRAIGGNPAVSLAGAQPTPEAIAAISEEIGTDRSLGAQYGSFLGNIVTLDLGESYFTKQSVWSEVTSRAPGTIELVVCGALLALLLGVALGALAALRRGRLADHATQGASILAFSTPDFFLGLVLAFFLYFKLRWLPETSGQLPFAYSPPEKHTGFVPLDAAIDGSWDACWAALKQLVLPALTLGLVYFASIYKITRSAMLEVLRSDFLTYAEACGLSRSLEVRYALRHALSLVVTYLGIIVAALIGGVVLVENVFSWGGLAAYGVEAIQKNDYPAVQGFVVAVGFISIVVYFLVDVLYAVIDPRVRLA
jgi:peptide/nickel transport system permease protein